MAGNSLSSGGRVRLLRRRIYLLPGLAAGLAALGVLLVLSIMLGAAEISPAVVFDAIFEFDGESFDHLVIRTVRLPRVICGIFVGAALASPGAVMQGLTQNPLASPGILGLMRVRLSRWFWRCLS